MPLPCAGTYCHCHAADTITPVQQGIFVTCGLCQIQGHTKHSRSRPRTDCKAKDFGLNDQGQGLTLLQILISLCQMVTGNLNPEVYFAPISSPWVKFTCCDTSPLNRLPCKVSECVSSGFNVPINKHIIRHFGDELVS